MSRLDEIKARLNAASPGKWRRIRHQDAADPMVGRGRGKSVHVISTSITLPRDADFIANAPADIAWLLGLVEAQRWQLSESGKQLFARRLEIRKLERKLKEVLK